ncbi:MAG: hypothetical protein JXR70_08640 [Spirochaetales bacterium]|nr:hypothetical protein [Spirochaetales bacterium]
MKFKKYASPFIVTLLALLVGLFYFLTHLHYMQRALDWDQIVYSNNIKKSLGNTSPPVFNPHHLHYEIGGKVFHEAMVENLGDKGFTDLSFNQRLRSLLFACLGLIFLVLFLSELTGKWFWGILGALLVGVTHGYLSYSTRVDTGIFPSAWFVMFLWILLRMVKAKKGLIYYSLPAAIVLFIGVMFHQYTAFGCAIFCLVLVVPGKLFELYPKPHVIRMSKGKKTEEQSEINRNFQARWLTAGVTALLALVFIVGGYFLVGESIYRLPLSGEKGNRAVAQAPWVYDDLTFQKWLFHYVYIDHGNWGKGIEEFTPRDAFFGFSEAFLARPRSEKKAGSPLNYDFRDFFHPEHLTHNLAALFSFFTLVGSVFLFPQLLKRYKRIFLFVFLSLLVFAVFTTYWEPYYFEFWITPALLVVVLFILIINLMAEKVSRFLGKIVFAPAVLIVLVFLCFFGAHNIKNHFPFFSLEQKLYGYNTAWDRDYYMKLFSRDIYRFPDDPYKDVYGHLKK